MQVSFSSPAARAICESSARMTQLWGSEAADVQFCLALLVAAANLGDLKGFRCITVERIAVGIAPTRAGSNSDGLLLRWQSAYLVVAFSSHSTAAPSSKHPEPWAGVDRCEVVDVVCSGIPCRDSAAS